ncbi:MAG: GTP-binding protein [Actinomycetota bacterium]
MRPDLREAFATIREAVALGGAELGDTRPVLRDVGDAEARHRTTGNHTVAALVGGTGSGKSTLFNALTRSSLADPGHARPSTRQASACAWGRRADVLLDHLEVPHARRMFQDCLLEREGLRSLDGLVLLDLPDHDSVEERHAAQVDRLLPVLDVLIWVVDPQKYADHILHEVYLRSLTARSDAMVMVLNQVDTLDESGREAVAADIQRILAEEGLDQVPVLLSCAITGDGVAAIRNVLADAVELESTADRTAAVALDGVGRTLLRRVGPPAAPLGDDMLDRTVDELLRATGVEAVAASIGAAVARWRGGALAEPQNPSRAAIAAIGSHWAVRAKADLPAAWSHAVDDALPSVEELGDLTAAAVASVPLPPVTVPRARAFMWAGIAASVAAVGLVVAGLALSWLPGWVAGPPVVLAVAAAALFASARRTRANVARQRAGAYEREVRAALRAAASDVLAAPTRAVLDRHSRVGQALAAVLRPSTGEVRAPVSTD